MDRAEAAIRELVAALREELRPENGPDRLLSIDETSAALGLSRSSVYGLIASGQLRSLKVLDRRMVSAVALRQFIEQADPHNGKAAGAFEVPPTAVESDRGHRTPATG